MNLRLTIPYMSQMKKQSTKILRKRRCLKRFQIRQFIVKFNMNKPLLDLSMSARVAWVELDSVVPRQCPPATTSALLSLRHSTNAHQAQAHGQPLLHQYLPVSTSVHRFRLLLAGLLPVLDHLYPWHPLPLSQQAFRSDLLFLLLPISLCLVLN